MKNSLTKPNDSQIATDPRENFIYHSALMPIFVWIGFVCSISFMEAWLKFRAPGLSLSVGLSIGRVIFAALNKVEWTFAGLTLLFLLLGKRKPKLAESIALCIPIAILALQTSFLLPALNDRAAAISQGLSVSSSSVHFYYIFFESLKILSLFIFGINMVCGLSRDRKRKTVKEY